MTALTSHIPISAPASPNKRIMLGLVLVGGIAGIATIAITFTGSAPAWLWQSAGLALGTLLSEDLTCATAGQLIANGQMHWLPAVTGCFVGIYVGDLLLWLAGRMIGRRVLNWPWLASRISARRFQHLADWLDRRGWIAVVAARFLPGTRLPLYLAAGTLGRKGGRFALWTLLAALLWTPAVVLLARAVGTQFQLWRSDRIGVWLSFAAGAVATLVLLKLAVTLSTHIGRAKAAARISKLWRWEFWPTWLFYAPIVPWITYQSLRRGGLRGFASITAANPGIPLGGLVGESKFQILSALAGEHVLPAALIHPGDLVARMAEQLDHVLTERSWTLPLVLKPDVGERGAGVKLVSTREEACDYLTNHAGLTIVQVFHSGPYEAGVFYYRFPHEPAGHIFSITDKVFPDIVGDGSSTLEELIWHHPRYRMQARTFLDRHAEQTDRVLPRGEVFRLATTGNHCQGTLFRDGVSLMSAELERTIDQIARRFDGFHFGRFDVRYSNPDEFKAGRDLAIVELNGVTSESTNLYDPGKSLRDAYRILLDQWSLLFRIADANRQAGVPAAGVREMLGSLLRSVRSRPRH